ncbi:hypothetical protein AXG93_3673s1020 [Marchantia polymorpha subsp. ruderalis]|uniref:Uncharacterized protein n=1 Tax=Marchantia polymorpha subsp. ruderalis TaxID=1480154 RepID=A0A176VE38_MARPO|nr:hypothetical protein AXG93_3673s1020 [Marchantia polymorpha subsp. ruderalis]
MGQIGGIRLTALKEPKKLKREEEAMGRSIRLTALRVHELGLRAYCGKLILAKMDFLLWGWNWEMMTTLPLTVRMLRGMDLLTAAKRREFPMRRKYIQDGIRSFGGYLDEDSFGEAS